MIRLQIYPAFRALLQANGLGSYAQIMQISSGKTIEVDSLRDVRCLQLDGQTLYLKQTWVEKPSSALESYFRGRLAHSKPFREMLQFGYLARLGFDVAEVIASGEELRYGIPLRGFIITRVVPGRDLSLAYRAANANDRRCIISQFGALLVASTIMAFLASRA
jgi:hypothetical protein